MSLRFASFSQNQFNLLKGVARPNLLRAEISPKRDILSGEKDPGLTRGLYETTLTTQANSSAKITERYGEGQALHEAENNIQSSQNTLSSIAAIYEIAQTKLARMQELADTDSSTFSLNDRVLLDLEYQDLKRDIQDLVNNNPFDEKFYIGQNITEDVQDLIPALQQISLIATRTERDLASRRGGNNVDLNGDSENAVLSDNARYVAFESDATNVGADTNGHRDIFIKDRFNGNLRNITAGGTGGDSFGASISRNGRYVAFLSTATSLVAGTTAGRQHAYVYDRNTNNISLVSADDLGVEADADITSVKISGNGNAFVFTTAATNLVAGDTNAVSDAFVKQRVSGAVERVSISTAGIEGNGAVEAANISDNGRRVVFTSRATNLNATDTNTNRDVYYHDRNTDITRHVSISTAGTGSNGDASLDSLGISNNGQRILFASEADNLSVNDVNGTTKDIFVRVGAGAGGVINIVSHAQGSANSANGASANASITRNGRRVVFSSDATNMIGNDTNGRTDVYTYNVNNQNIYRISNSDNDDLPPNVNAASLNPFISTNGNFVSYSGSDNALYPNDTNGFSDVFIRNVGNNTGTTRFFQNQHIAFDFLYESTDSIDINSLNYQVNTVTGGLTPTHNTTGSLPPLAGGNTNRTRGDIDLDFAIPNGTNGNTVNITLTLTVNDTIHVVEFAPFTIGQLREGAQLQAISVDGKLINNTPVPVATSRTLSNEQILSGTSILGEDRLNFTSFHLNERSLDRAFSGSHLATESSRQLASDMMKDVITYVDEGAARINAALKVFESAKGIDNLAGFEEKLSSSTLYRYNTPDALSREGEAELYDDFSIDQSVSYALSVSNYIGDILDMITDDTANYNPDDPKTGLSKDYNQNSSILKEWETAYEQENTSAAE